MKRFAYLLVCCLVSMAVCANVITYTADDVTVFPNPERGFTDELGGETMLSETVCVPFTFARVNERMEPIDSTRMELVAGIVAVKEDTATFALTPQIGWLVRKPYQK